MITSLALIFLTGMIMGSIFQRLQLPSIIGMLVAGILIGPYGFNLLTADILTLAPQLRQIALVIILTRAGLSLNLSDIKSVGRPAAFLSFLPATFEIIGITYIAPFLFKISTIEAFLLACVLAAVSPAVIVPRMLDLKERGFGQKRRIPELITLAASLDDIFVIVLFTSALNLVNQNNIGFHTITSVISSLILGVLSGILLGLFFLWITKFFQINYSYKIILLLSIFFLTLYLETYATGAIGFSALLSIMCTGITINYKSPTTAKSFSHTFEQLWQGASILLFVLVGSSLNIGVIGSYGYLSLILVAIGILCRFGGVCTSLIDTPFHKKEKLFITYSYIPKATVQAAIGGIPLAMGLDCGELILTISILSVLITAPLGAILIDRNYRKLLPRVTK